MSSDQRIALFLHWLAGGGAERIFLTLADSLVARGHAVDLVLANAAGPYLGQVGPGVRVVDLRSPRMLRCLPGLVGYLRRERPLALLSALNYANVVAIAAGRISGAGVPVLATEHNVIASGEFRSARWRAILQLMRLTYPLADRVIAVSEGVAAELADATRLPRDRIDVVYNPAVTPGMMDRASRRVDHPWFSDGAPPVILGVGRMTEQKDFNLLLEAFARVSRKRPCRLAILGEGEERPRLEAAALRLGLVPGQDVIMPGFVENPYAWMRQAEIFVLSSRWEGLPTVLIEAMACGTRVVSTDCPSGPAEILEGGRHGRLVPVGDAGALASAIDAALDEPRSKAVIDRAAFFDVDRSVDRYLDLIMAAQRRRGVSPAMPPLRADLPKQ